MFHALARNCADMLIGASAAGRSRRAWLEVYRSLAHGSAKAACDHKRTIGRFPIGIREFASAFSDLQDLRHSADYDPTVTFYRSTVKADITRAEQAIESFATVTVKDRRAFASWVLFRDRTRGR